MSRRTTLQHGPRRAVLVGLLVFVGLQGAMALLVEVWYPGWREPRLTSRVEHYRSRTATEKDNGRRVLFLGSSRFEHGIHVRQLESELSARIGTDVAVFNYGVSGGSIRTSQRQWRRLRDEAAKPDLAVVEVIPSSLHADVPSIDNSAAVAPPGELDWSEIAELVRSDPSRHELYRENLLARAVPQYGHRLIFTSRLLPNLLPPKHRRLPDRFRDVEEDIPLAKRPLALKQARNEHGGNLGAFRLGQHHLRDLETLLLDLRSAGVPAVVLVMPEGPAFRSWYRPGAWAEVESALQNVCSACAARFVSAREWMDEDAFFDSHHLTVSGGRQFSQRLGKEVIESSLQRPRDLRLVASK